MWCCVVVWYLDKMLCDVHDHTCGRRDFPLGEVTQLGSEVTSCVMNYLLRNESGNAKIFFLPIQIDSSKDYARKVGNARSLATLWKHLFTINEYTHYNIRIFLDSSFSCNLYSLDSICLAIESSN